MKTSKFVIKIDVDHEGQLDELNLEQLKKLLLDSIANVLKTGKAPGEFSITKIEDGKIRGKSSMEL